MGPAIGDVLPYAVGLAIIPIPVIGVILVLFTPRARINGPAFAAGWVAALVAVGGATVLFADAGDVDSEETASDLAFAVLLVLGVAFLALAFKQWQGRPRTGEEPEMPGWMKTIEDISPGKAFGLAFLLAALNPKNLILILGAGVIIAQAGLDSAEQWLTLLAFTAIASISVTGPVIYYFIAGKAAERQLDSLRSWLLENNATVMAILLLVVGVVFFGRGFAGLTA